METIITVSFSAKKIVSSATLIIPPLNLASTIPANPPPPPGPGQGPKLILTKYRTTTKYSHYTRKKKPKLLGLLFPIILISHHCLKISQVLTKKTKLISNIHSKLKIKNILSLNSMDPYKITLNYLEEFNQLKSIDHHDHIIILLYSIILPSHSFYIIIL